MNKLTADHEIPADRVAARVVMPGERHTAGRGPRRNTFDAPPKFRKPGVGEAQIAGKRFGRLIVLGIATESWGGRGAKWVVRCDCGNYEFRRHHALHNPENAHDRCAECDRRAFVRKSYLFASTGKHVEIRSL